MRCENKSLSSVHILLNINLKFFQKKRKVFDFFNTGNKCFIKIIIESSPQDIWIRIRFLEKTTDPHHWLLHILTSRVVLVYISLYIFLINWFSCLSILYIVLMNNISLDFRQRPRISYSDSCTFLPGLEPRTKNRKIDIDRWIDW